MWTEALETLRERISPENFSTWLEPIECDGIDAQGVRLRVPNRFYADWIHAHYLPLIVECLQQRAANTGFASDGADGGWPKVHWQVDEGLQARLRPARDTAPTVAVEAVGKAPKGVAAKPAAATAGKANHGQVEHAPAGEAKAELHPRYLFDAFVVGPSNQLAHAAALAVCNAPGRRYNPLFIYGGVGLGKTHLLNAVGHRLQSEPATRRVRYVSAERFTNEFISALRSHRIDDFRQHFRSECDVLLMDDIQFLAGREQTQEEFFHTFNALHLAGKQIVVTSDVDPQRIADMQERLISRFQSGMVADTQPPELDTRIAILQQKAAHEGIHLPNEAALAIAKRVSSNVRELEGTLLRLAVKAEIMHRSLDAALIESLLEERQLSLPQLQSFEGIQRVVCEHFRLRLSDLKSSRRARTITFPRMLAMYLCRHRLHASYPEIGEQFGGKDHTTVINAVRKIHQLANDDATTRTALDSIARKLGDKL